MSGKSYSDMMLDELRQAGWIVRLNEVRHDLWRAEAVRPAANPQRQTFIVEADGELGAILELQRQIRQASSSGQSA